MVETNLKKSSDLEFVLHVIPPPMKLDWSSPRSLFISTLLNHSRKDKAPIGHLFIEFTLPKERPSEFQGGSRIITGMTRQKMSLLDSIKLLQGKRLGLGSVFYDFKGKLDSISEAHEEISWAKNKKRHATIRVSITEERASTMLGFLKNWLEHGSFKHYSGGLRVGLGEGAGCAEFGMQFLSMALDLQAIHPEWMRKVKIPHRLIGGGFTGQLNKVSIFDIFKNGSRWANESEPNLVYATPDPELIFDWIKNKSGLNVDLVTQDITWSHGKLVKQEFKVNYQPETTESVQEQWARIVD